jgi:hypothetical protein
VAHSVAFAGVTRSGRHTASLRRSAARGEGRDALVAALDRSPPAGTGSASLWRWSGRRPRARTSSRSTTRTPARAGSRSGRRAPRFPRSTTCAPVRARPRACRRPRASILLPATFAPSVPDTASKVSVCPGCTCAAATKASGSARSSTSTYSPPVSAEVRMNVIRSPVTGLTSVCPALTMVRPPVARWSERRHGGVGAEPSSALSPVGRVVGNPGRGPRVGGRAPYAPGPPSGPLRRPRALRAPRRAVVAR